MAGQIIVSSIKTDSDNSISFVSNTGATIFSANLASGLSIDSFGNNSITSDKIVSVANTKIAGTINTNQIADSAITSEKIAVGAIPPSDNASALTTGTLPIERIADGTVTAAKLATGAAATNLGNYVTSVNGSTGAVTVSTTPPTGYAEIGTYLACYGRGYWSRSVNAYTAPGATTAGSNLYRGQGTGNSCVGTGTVPVTNADGAAFTVCFPSSSQQTSLSLSGTWRCMTWTVAATNYDSTTAAAGLFVRIS